MAWCAPLETRSMLSVPRVLLAAMIPPVVVADQLSNSYTCPCRRLFPAERGGDAGSSTSSCRVALFAFFARLVGRQPVVERLETDAEHVGRFALGAALGERGLDQAPAHLVERGSDPHREERRGVGRGDRRRREVRVDHV